MKVCIIGASGYIGGWLIGHFAENGHEVIAAYRKEPEGQEDWNKKMYKTIKGDVQDKAFLQQIADEEPEVVVYLVSLNHFQSEDDVSRSLQINVAPVLELAGMLAKQPSLKAFLYFSTLQVLGKINTGEVITEQRAIAPMNMYGLTHALCEEGLQLLKRKHNFPACSLRLSNSYGMPKFSSCDSLWLVINEFCLNAVNDQLIQLKSDGTPQRDFIYLKDVARAVEFLATREASQLPSVVNLASGETLTMLELAQVTAGICKELGLDVTVKLPDGTVSTNADHHRDVQKFRIESWLTSQGFSMNTTLQEGIKVSLAQLLKR